MRSEKAKIPYQRQADCERFKRLICRSDQSIADSDQPLMHGRFAIELRGLRLPENVSHVFRCHTARIQHLHSPSDFPLIGDMREMPWADRVETGGHRRGSIGEKFDAWDYYPAGESAFPFPISRDRWV